MNGFAEEDDDHLQMDTVPSEEDRSIIDRFRRPLTWISPGTPLAYLVAVSTILAGTAIRLLIGITFGPGIIPFATYFPGVLFTTLIAGGRAGAVATLLGGLIGFKLFAPMFYQASVTPTVSIVSIVLYAFCSGLIIAIAVAYRSAIQALWLEQEKSRMLSRELEHRIRNTVAIIQSLIARTLGANNPNTKILNRRISAITATEPLLHRAPGVSNLHSLAVGELEPYDLARIKITGAELVVSHEIALVAVLLFHELATNAAKHGTLQISSGTIELNWRQSDGDLLIEWTEHHGPPIRPPERTGFGMTLMEQAVQNIKGQIEIDYPSTGLRAQIKIPLAP